MKIAILMSTYNGEKYLNEQLESLFNQQVDGHMVIYIRDDGSNDSTIEIIKKWKQKLDIVLFEEENVGPSQSFWQLFMNADIQAEYYAFCDQDDIWDIDKLEKSIKKLSEYSETPALWCSNCRIINENDAVISSAMNKEQPDFNISSQFVCGTTQGCAMVFNNSLRKIIFSKQFTGYPMHDFVVITNAILYGKVIYDHKSSFGYRVHSNNVVAKSGKNVFTRLKSSFEYWFSEKHKGEISKYADELLKKNENDIEERQKLFLQKLINSRNSFTSRMWIIKFSKDKTTNASALRSFRLRVLLGII